MTVYLYYYIMLILMVALQNKYRQAYDNSRGQPTAIITDSPEMIRIRKAQEQLSEVKTVEHNVVLYIMSSEV